MARTLSLAMAMTAAFALSCGGGSRSTYQPCAGKQCGDPCHQCPPNDPSCVEAAVTSFCTGDGGTCSEVAPPCPSPGSVPAGLQGHG